jgi:FAD/FMN-containing dehydrogenase
MTSTTYNNETKIVSVQPGSKWQSVYETLDPYGVTVTGGRAGNVGVGGFIVGGGNSFHSASHGFACDTVQNFELVLANSSIVNANADENPDLWRALKGGSANFGLVTRFDMYAIELPNPNTTDVWGGLLMYDLSATDAIIDKYVKFADNVESDQNSSTIIFWAYVPAAGGMLLNAALVNTINAVSPPAFDGYLSTPGIISNSLRSTPMYEITAEIGAAQPVGFRYLCPSLKV